MTKSILVPVEPVVPPAPYLGGKRYLAGRIIERIAAVPHNSYVEPFVGMGGVFLRRPFKATAEVINDINGDVATLFRVLQRHYLALMDMLRWQITSRDEFERLVATNGETLTDLERAARFLYVQRVSFGGRVRSPNFGVAKARPARFDVATLGPVLEDIHRRLSGVVIERLDWEALVPRYDAPGTLYYLDPPYFGCERDYGDGVFERADFERMAAVLGALKGRFIMSLDASPEVRRIFRRFQIEEVETTYTVARGGGKRVTELLISG
ncbi:DNA adenine methylase [Acidocella sp.]|uniref:DNA adenine methylase n=1 Tax=Acidocella sp. TaxID=50710 RepID=UPI0026191C34|nr:DNA adenine methylase [Acidocella sp.]